LKFFAVKNISYFGRQISTLETRSFTVLVLISLALVAAVGVIDYLTGFEMFFSVFYLLGVAFAAWFVGRTFGFIMSVLSVLVWLGGDLAAGAHYSRPWILCWNAVILTVIYFVVVMLLSHLRAAQRDLAMRVDQRTQALRREMAERERLESEILKVSEREQRRIGHELHDGLCQHLTATALAGQVLSEKLASRSLPENADADKIVGLIEQGIDIARDLARGLYPVEMEAEGLMAAFHELTTNLSKGAKVDCKFQCETPVLIHDNAIAAHLFCIGQEAVRNALRHGKPQRIGVTLSEHGGQVSLTVEDDGIGLPEDFIGNEGLGMRIMSYRAASIGGKVEVEPGPTGGTIVTCRLPSTLNPINANGFSG
jgi:signal transduction histidine kinase